MNITIVTEATDFRTICGRNDDTFDKKIREHLQDGWKMFGVPYVVSSTSYNWTTIYLIKQ